MHVICGKCSSLIVIEEETRSDDYFLLSSKSQPSEAIKNDLPTPGAGSCILSSASSSSSSSASLSSSLSSLPWRDVIFDRILIHLHLTDLFRMRRVSRTFCSLINSYFQQMDQLDMREVTSLGFNSHSFGVIIRQKKKQNTKMKNQEDLQLYGHLCERSHTTPSPPPSHSLESYESGENDSTRRGSGNHINSPAPSSPTAPGHEEGDGNQEGQDDYFTSGGEEDDDDEGGEAALIKTLNLNSCKWLSDQDLRDVITTNPSHLCKLDLSGCFEVNGYSSCHAFCTSPFFGGHDSCIA